MSLNTNAILGCISLSSSQAKLEDYRQEVELLKAKLAELDLKQAGLASQNRILEEAAAAVQAKSEKASDCQI